MYQPKHFEQADALVLHALMREYPLATLVTTGSDGLTADLVPLEYDATHGTHGVLRGHVARANPMWQQANLQPVLAVFQGPQAYVSPSWYATKAQTHKVVPTWNYCVVQARGTLHAVEDAAWLHAFVSRLTKSHEARQAAPWSVTDAPEDFVQQMLRAIVGFEIPLTQLVGKWKVSQNRGEADRAGVAAALSHDPADGAAAMAAVLRRSTDQR
jgi:transcriptional regulator